MSGNRLGIRERGSEKSCGKVEESRSMTTDRRASVSPFVPLIKQIPGSSCNHHRYYHCPKINITHTHLTPKNGYLVSAQLNLIYQIPISHDNTHSSILQGGYHHPTARKWQAKRQLTKSMFMYPIFITDDPDASVDIPTLPGQRRWGVNKLEGFLAPLVKKGLESVILFGVPLSCAKVCWVFILICAEEIANAKSRMAGAPQQTTLPGQL